MPVRHTTRKKNPVRFKHSISNANIETCDSEKDLGVWVLQGQQAVGIPSKFQKKALGTRLVCMYLGEVFKIKKDNNLKAKCKVLHFSWVNSLHVSYLAYFKYRQASGKYLLVYFNQLVCI